MKRIMLSASSLLVIAAALGGATAQAADLSAPVYTKAPAVEAWNPWMVRLRVLGVIPDASGSTVNVGAPVIAALSSPNSGLSIGSAVVPELDISYFFTQNIAAELILGVTKHSIKGTGTLAGLDIGKSWLLPPTLTLQYHFTGMGGFKPYIGAGVNYTVFFSQSAANVVSVTGPTAGLATTGLSVKNSFGAVVQAGFDYMVDRHWGLNFDVKKVFLRPDYTATVSNVVPVSGRANIDPWLIAGGITYKF